MSHEPDTFSIRDAANSDPATTDADVSANVKKDVITAPAGPVMVERSFAPFLEPCYGGPTGNGTSFQLREEKFAKYTKEEKKNHDIGQKMLDLAGVRLEGGRPFDVRVHNPRMLQRILSKGSLGLGEAFMEGWWDTRDFYSLHIFFEKILRGGIEYYFPNNAMDLANVLKARVMNPQTKKRSKRVGLMHYDTGNEFFEAMLGAYMQYSCAYWVTHKPASELTAADRGAIRALRERNADAVEGRDGFDGNARDETFLPVEDEAAAATRRAAAHAAAEARKKAEAELDGAGFRAASAEEADDESNKTSLGDKLKKQFKKIVEFDDGDRDGGDKKAKEATTTAAAINGNGRANGTTATTTTAAAKKPTTNGTANSTDSSREAEEMEKLLQPRNGLVAVPITNLVDAQLAKLRMIGEKLNLRPGMEVLDVGCGWGGLALFLAQEYKVKVVGITISEEQKKNAEDLTSAHREDIQILVVDYRELKKHYANKCGQPNKRFDRIVSVGMFEHVGPKNYKKYFTTMRSLLSDEDPGAVMVLHTIGSKQTMESADQWYLKYIFPGGCLPSITNIGKEVENIFVIEDAHNFGYHYYLTLMAWRQRFLEYWVSMQSTPGSANVKIKSKQAVKAEEKAVAKRKKVDAAAAASSSSDSVRSPNAASDASRRGNSNPPVLSDTDQAQRQEDREVFFRMFYYYLSSSAGAFKARDLQLWQMVLSPNGVNGYADVFRP